MKDVLKIVIFALALVGMVTLIVHLHWLGAIGVLGVVWSDIKATSEAADRVIDRILNLWDKWQANKKEVKEENSDE